MSDLKSVQAAPSVRWLGVLSIAFGFVLGSCGAWEGLFFVRPGLLGETPRRPEFLQYLETSVRGYTVVTGGHLLINLILSTLLIVAGFGVLLRRPWSRWLSVGYAVFTLLSYAGLCLYQIMRVNPATVQYFQQPQFLTTHNVESVTYAIVGSAYALVLLVCVNLRGVRQALGRPAPKLGG